MEVILWSDAMSVGDLNIDKQHRKLIEIINSLISNPNIDTHSQLISDTLTELTKYTLQHFKDEEDMMELLDYPGLEKHKIEHRSFAAKVSDFCIQVMADKNGVPEEMLLFLKDWLTDHILESDMQYARYFETH